MPACTRCGRWRISICERRCRRRRLRRGINDELPADIHVLAVDSVPHRFHARHGAVARSYLYQIARRRSAFAKPFVWWVKEPLDLERMTDAAARFTGMHDFQAFSDDDPDEKSTDVLVEDVTLGEDGDLILVRVGGSHFIWKMVRRMVGVLVEVGKGQLDPDDVAGLLGRWQRSRTGRVADAGAAYRAGIRPVSRAGVLRRRSAVAPAATCGACSPCARVK